MTGTSSLKEHDVQPNLDQSDSRAWKVFYDDGRATNGRRICSLFCVDLA